MTPKTKLACDTFDGRATVGTWGSLCEELADDPEFVAYVAKDLDADGWTNTGGGSAPDNILCTVDHLATTFREMLREEIGEDAFVEVLAENRRRDGSGLPCASHDYCDASVTMLQAFEGVFRREWDSATDDIEVLSAAWTAAHLR